MQLLHCHGGLLQTLRKFELTQAKMKLESKHKRYESHTDWAHNIARILHNFYSFHILHCMNLLLQDHDQVQPVDCPIPERNDNIPQHSELLNQICAFCSKKFSINIQRAKLNISFHNHHQSSLPELFPQLKNA